MKQELKFKEMEIGNIPKDWEVDALGNHTKIIKGISYRSKDYCSEDEGFIFINLKCIARNGGFRKDGIKYYKGELKKEQFVNAGDIVIANTDLTQNREIIGSPLKIPELKNDRKMCISLDLSKLDVTSKKLDGNFLYYYLMSPRARNFMIANGNGTTVVHLSTKNVPNMVIPLPGIEEQKRIAKILSDLDKKIEINNNLSYNLEKSAELLFKQWFIDFEFPNEKGEPYKSSGGAMVNSEFGEIPKDWRVVKLKELVYHSKESINPSANPNTIYDHYSIPAYDLNKVPIRQTGNLILSNKFVVKNNSILISKLNPRVPRVWAIVKKNNNPAICSTEFQVIIPKNEEEYGFVHSLVVSDYFKQRMINQVTGTSSSHQRVRPKDILNVNVLLPVGAILKKFSLIINPILIKINSNIVNNLLSEGSKRILISKLINGQIRTK